MTRKPVAVTRFAVSGFMFRLTVVRSVEKAFPLSSVATPGQPIVGYLWDFGDGTPNLTGAQVGHTFSRVGTYVVTLVVTDSAGRKGTATAQVVVAP